jgi:hypothetical protein
VTAYLARLVRSAESDAADVRPRLPSIFEPVDVGAVKTPIVGLPSEGIADEVEHPSRAPAISADRAIEPPAPVVVMRSADQHRATPPASAVESKRHRVTLESAPPPDDPKEASGSPVRRAPESGDEGDRAGFIAMRPPIRVVRIAERDHRSQPEHVEWSGRTGVPSAPPRSPEAATRHDTGPPGNVGRAASTSPLAQPTIHSGTIPGVASKRSREPPTIIRSASILPILPTLESRRLQASGRMNPPIVRITIGRIDVRAVPPTPPAEAKKPPARRRPSMSLADYLERRNGRQP